VLWIWIQNLQFGSGTREKPSGYTTHEITIFKYKMGDFFFWPKNGVSAIKVSLWYFKTKILPFYSLLSGSSSWGNFYWTGRSRSRPLIPFCCLLMVLLPSCLGFVCQEACHCRTFRKLSWSIFIILSRWDSTPLLNEEEDGDLVSPVQMPVEFHILFSIIKASTANQGKRKHMSFLSSVFIWQLIKAIFFFHFLWHGCDCLSVYFSTITPIKRYCSSLLCRAVLWCADGSTGLH
jgi:hypothetical protein